MNDFEEIYKKYLKDVYRFLLKLSGTPAVAEELTQETFFIAFEKLDQFKGTCKISVWLCQIAKHQYYAYCRKQKNVAGEMDEAHYSHPGNLEEEFIDHTEQLRIHEVLHKLKEPYKEVFTLRVMGELSYRDISRLFGKSESWARVTYYRAKCMIVEELGGENHDEM